MLYSKTMICLVEINLKWRWITSLHANVQTKLLIFHQSVGVYLQLQTHRIPLESASNFVFSKHCPRLLEPPDIRLIASLVQFMSRLTNDVSLIKVISETKVDNCFYHTRIYAGYHLMSSNKYPSSTLIPIQTSAHCPHLLAYYKVHLQTEMACDQPWQKSRAGKKRNKDL